MENNEISSDRKFINKAKSHCSGQSKKLRSEPAKRKSFNVNEAVKTMDLALGRLKKSKLVNGEFIPHTAHTSPDRGRTHMFINNLARPNVNMADVDNSSLISMNFSHYELMRNVSQSNCNSEGAFSNTTSDLFSSLSDITSRDEHLERYFRSVDIWSRNHKDSGPSSLQDSLCDK